MTYQRKVDWLVATVLPCICVAGLVAWGGILYVVGVALGLVR